MRSLIILLTLFVYSCSGDDKQTQKEQVSTYDTSTLYYDIPLAIKNEMAEIKRTFAYTYKITIENNTRDSTEIDSTTLLQLAAPFLELDLNDRNRRKYYKEDIFEDGDTKSIVLNYTTNNPELPAKSVSVMLNNETQQLKRIDILKAYVSNDTTYEERLAWVANKNFQIIRLASSKGNELTKQVYVYWQQR